MRYQHDHREGFNTVKRTQEMNTEGQCILISLCERYCKLKICYLSSYFPFLWFKCSKPPAPYKINFGKGANGKYLQSDIRWLPPHM